MADRKFFLYMAFVAVSIRKYIISYLTKCEIINTAVKIPLLDVYLKKKKKTC